LPHPGIDATPAARQAAAREVFHRMVASAAQAGARRQSTPQRLEQACVQIAHGMRASLAG